MKTGNKSVWMTWAIIILAVMNITTIVTVLYQRNQAGREKAYPVNGQTVSEYTSLRYSGRWFRDQLNLNGDQMARFVEFNPSFREKARNINRELDLLRQEMLHELSGEKCDETRLNLLSDSIGIMHSDLKRATCRYYMDIKNICDQQQKQKLEQLFSGMFAGDALTGRYGKGGQQGRHRGRPINN
jgi:hypothetical protein